MDEKQKYVKKSTYSAYVLLLKNHILPYFGNYEKITEKDVQEFVLKKLEDERAKLDKEIEAYLKELGL